MTRLDIDDMIDAAIMLEETVSALYSTYATLFPQDKQFWMHMSTDESNHARTIGAARQFFPASIELRGIMPKSISQIRSANERITDMRRTAVTEPPSRSDALVLATELEESTCEYHQQCFMDISSKDSQVTSLFQRLNNMEKDHLKRVENYISSSGI